MNILFCNETPFFSNLGGVERVSCLLAQEFIKGGHVPVFFSLKNENNYIHSTDGIKRYYLSNDIADPNLFFIELLQKEKIDIIINQTPVYDMYKLLKNCNKKNIKIVTVIHNQPFSTFGKEKIYKKLVTPSTIRAKILKQIGRFFPSVYRKGRFNFDLNRLEYLLEISDKIFLLSDRYIKRITNLAPQLNINKFDAINNPNTFDSEIENTEKDNIVLFIGRFYDPQKNVTGFIDVWEKFHKNCPDWKAIVVGDGPDKEKICKYAKTRGVENIQFTGNRKDVTNFYSKAKFLCMTSLYEGWPMVLSEAMHHRCIPFVYNTFEAVDDIIQNGNSGIIIEDINASKMAEQMMLLAQDDKYREKIAINASSKIKDFSLEKIAKIWEEKLKAI